MPGTEVQLIIKAPNQNVDDHTVDCSLEWTVGELKEHLSLSYPNNPAVNEQKLIYSGHLLLDHVQLREILRHEDSQDSVHILHLVYNSQNPQHYQSSHAWRPTQSPSPPETSLVHRNVASAPTANAVYPQIPPLVERPATVPAVFPDPQVAAQIAAMQQMYAYYFTQYIQSLNPPPAPPRVEAPVVEQGGRGDGGGDWLEHLFVFLRLVVLFCVVYFYSTPERLMIVIVCAVIALLYHEGWFMRRLNPEPQRNHENDHPLNNQEANDDSHDEHDLEAAMDGDLPPHAHPPAAQHFSPLAFLSAFFSSLIPPPPPVNIN